MRKLLLAIFLSLFVSAAWSQAPARITVGAERIDQYLPLLQGRCIAVVANQASRVGDRHLVDTLLALGVNIQTIFSPEHGFRGNNEAGAHVADNTDPATGLPIFSLYGSNKKPSSQQLKGIELIIFDLQDVGCRFYTFISTLHYVLEAAAENALQVIVLDRPNPNAHYVDGPVLEASYQSFVGMHPGVPVVYGMTIGEYARMIVGERWITGADRLRLHVVPLLHYTYDSLYHLPIAPSPNLRTAQAIALYPSLCLFEGTNVSVGRGTDCPFEVIGRPSYKMRDYAFVPHSVPGVSDNPPHKGKTCYGLDLTGVEPCACFDLTYLLEMYRHSDKSTFFLKSNFFEKLAGTATLRRQLMQGASEQEIRASWAPGLAQFQTVRQRYLLYD